MSVSDGFAAGRGDDGMSTGALIERCHLETARYLRRKAFDAGPCMELLRRAFAEGDQWAYGGVVEVYVDLVLHWVQGQPGIEYAGEDERYLVHVAFERFFRFMTADMVSKMSLAQVMGYLKRCAMVTVVDAGRARRRRPETVADDVLEMLPAPGSVEDAVLAEMARGELLAAVLACCQDEAERVLAQRSMMDGLRPAEILDQNGELFGGVREIYLRRDALRRRLVRRRAEIAPIFV